MGPDQLRELAVMENLAPIYRNDRISVEPILNFRSIRVKIRVTAVATEMRSSLSRGPR